MHASYRWQTGAEMSTGSWEWVKRAVKVAGRLCAVELFLPDGTPIALHLLLAGRLDVSARADGVAGAMPPAIQRVAAHRAALWHRRTR